MQLATCHVPQPKWQQQSAKLTTWPKHFKSCCCPSRWWEVGGGGVCLLGADEVVITCRRSSETGGSLWQLLVMEYARCCCCCCFMLKCRCCPWRSGMHLQFACAAFLCIFQRINASNRDMPHAACGTRQGARIKCSQRTLSAMKNAFQYFLLLRLQTNTN